MDGRGGITPEALESMAKVIKGTRKVIVDFNALVTEMNFEQYKSPEDVRKNFNLGVVRVLKPVDASG